jgi:hypothetical protein
MFISRWIIAVALGLVLSTSLKAQDEAQSGEDGASGQQQPAQVLPIPIPVQIVEDDEIVSYRERREAENEQREIDGLNAQKGINTATQAMNEATQSMKNAAWLSFGAVALGTVALVYTLLLTRQANISAIGAISVTRDIGQAQTRSYLYVDTINATFDDGVIKGEVRIANSGTSPALSVKAATFWFCSNQGFDDQWVDISSLDGFGDMHPKAISWRPFRTDKEGDPEKYLEVAHIKEIVQGNTGFWLSGRVEYDDVFKRKWRLDYRYKFKRFGERNGFVVCAEGNSLNEIKGSDAGECRTLR